jgi:AraC-like DNA-binding protein
MYFSTMDGQEGNPLESALRAFENLTHLRVTVHDLVGSLTGRLANQRFWHGQHACRLLKPERTGACVRFDIDVLRAELLARPEGLVKVCHAGIAELVVPVAGTQAVDWVLMAGLRRPAAGLRGVLDDDADRRHGAWTRAVQALSPLDGVEASMLLESLRQLAARLRQLVPAGSRPPGDGQRAPMRAYIVHGWITANHTRDVALRDLAQHLHLSPSRSAEVVRQTCGASFIRLLGERRLHTAAALLRQTALGIAEVARAAGFRNLANFHRAFRRRYGTTPARWRSQRLPASAVLPGHA